MKDRYSTNVPYIENKETGDKVIYPFSPPIYQTLVDANFSKDLIEEGRKLTIKDDDFSSNLAGNLKYGRSYHYKKDYMDKVEPYLKTYVERFFNTLKDRFSDPHNNPHNTHNSFTMVEKLMTIQTGVREAKYGTLKLDTLWVNFSQKHDFNPPHTHTGVLSFVIFCKVPQEIFNVQADTNTKRAGEIIFTYGENFSPLMGSEYPVKPFDNLMFIFPNVLKHYVPPYWIDAERISVSGNFVVV